MSHEFRTPLGTALMFIEMVINLLTDEYSKKLLVLVKTSILLLLSLVSDVLDLKMLKSN